MTRFSVVSSGPRADVVFDDGGMNLLSSGTLEELAGLVAELRSTLGTRLVTFRSGREGLFAAGADMAEMQRFSPREAMEFSRLGQETFAAIERLPAITVALVDGDCFGGALDLALAFDLRHASRRSRFSHPGGKLGIATGFGGTARWRKVMGRGSARKLFLDNPVHSAEEAREAGLVDGIGDPDFDRLLALDPAMVRAVKELAVHGERMGRRELARLGEILGGVYGRGEGQGDTSS